MGEIGRRIERLKLQPFLDALERVFPQIDLPNRVPAKIRCLLPDHPDKTPSFSLREHRWHCFGCGRGGDLVDFAQAYYDSDLLEAIRTCEAALGFTNDSDADLRALVALAKATNTDVGPLTRIEWERMIGDVEEAFYQATFAYTRCYDPVVQDLAWGPVGYVYDELRTEGMQEPPRTQRLARETVRALRGWALDWARGIERDVQRATGKDRLDVAAQSPLALP